MSRPKGSSFSFQAESRPSKKPSGLAEGWNLEREVSVVCWSMESPWSETTHTPLIKGRRRDLSVDGVEAGTTRNLPDSRFPVESLVVLRIPYLHSTPHLRRPKRDGDRRRAGGRTIKLKPGRVTERVWVGGTVDLFTFEETYCPSSPQGTSY